MGPVHTNSHKQHRGSRFDSDAAGGMEQEAGDLIVRRPPQQEGVDLLP